MDLGVGGIIFTSGMVSRYSKGPLTNMTSTKTLTRSQETQDPSLRCCQFMLLHRAQGRFLHFLTINAHPLLSHASSATLLPLRFIFFMYYICLCVSDFFCPLVIFLFLASFTQQLTSLWFVCSMCACVQDVLEGMSLCGSLCAALLFIVVLSASSGCFASSSCPSPTCM